VIKEEKNFVAQLIHYLGASVKYTNIIKEKITKISKENDIYVCEDFSISI